MTRAAFCVSDAFSQGRFDDGESFRDAYRRLAAVVSRVLALLGDDEDIATKSRYIAICRLCGVPEYVGMSLRALAKQHGITPAAISAEVLELSAKLSFPSWRGDDLRRKSEAARIKYAAARRGKPWRRGSNPPVVIGGTLGIGGTED